MAQLKVYVVTNTTNEAKIKQAIVEKINKNAQEVGTDTYALTLTKNGDLYMFFCDSMVAKDVNLTSNMIKVNQKVDTNAVLNDMNSTFAPISLSSTVSSMQSTIDNLNNKISSLEALVGKLAQQGKGGNTNPGKQELDSPSVNKQDESGIIEIGGETSIASNTNTGTQKSVSSNEVEKTSTQPVQSNIANAPEQVSKIQESAQSNVEKASVQVSETLEPEQDRVEKELVKNNVAKEPVQVSVTQEPVQSNVVKEPEQTTSAQPEQENTVVTQTPEIPSASSKFYMGQIETENGSWNWDTYDESGYDAFDFLPYINNTSNDAKVFDYNSIVGTRTPITGELKSTDSFIWFAFEKGSENLEFNTDPNFDGLAAYPISDSKKYEITKDFGDGEKTYTVLITSDYQQSLPAIYVRAKQ